MGIFLTLEGGEGTGKSTQIKRLVNYLRERSVDLVLTREPGGSPSAESVRQVLLEGDPDRWDALSEYLLYSAARHDHVRRTIVPALAAGKWVICDRFYDSSYVYQGIVGGVDLSFMDRVYHQVTGGLVPRLTLVLDVPVSMGLARAGDRGGVENRFESKSLDYHEQVRAGYLNLVKTQPQRCVLIDATQSTDYVFQQILTHVTRLLTEAVCG